MAEYQLTDSKDVVRTSDNARIPADPANRDRADYTAWLAAGGVPDPYVPPAPTDLMDTWDLITLKIAFIHENRIRALEAKAPVTLAQFKNAVKALL